MHVTVCAMMVGDDEAVVGNDASGASEIQREHRVLEGSALSVRIVYLVGIEFQALGLHVCLQGLGDGMDHPHALVRVSGEGTEQDGRKQRHYAEYRTGTHGRDYLPATASSWTSIS